MQKLKKIELKFNAHCNINENNQSPIENNLLIIWDSAIDIPKHRKVISTVIRSEYGDKIFKEATIHTVMRKDIKLNPTQLQNIKVTYINPNGNATGKLLKIAKKSLKQQKFTVVISISYNPYFNDEMGNLLSKSSNIDFKVYNTKFLTNFFKEKIINLQEEICTINNSIKNL